MIIIIIIALFSLVILACGPFSVQLPDGKPLDRKNLYASVTLRPCGSISVFIS